MHSMAGRRGDSNRRQRKRTRGRRMVSAGWLVAACVAIGMTSPVAHADDFGLADLIGDLLGGATAGAGDASAQAALEGSAQGIDHALAAVSGTDPLAGLLNATGLNEVTATGETQFQQLFYDPIHTAVESWINSPLGGQFDAFLNQISGQFLIGDGVDGTAASPDGGDGGLWFGDGGNGFNETAAGAAGGNGGSAGILGDGGYGGDGGAGADGGAGGDGGSFMGNGGVGGDGGQGFNGGAGGDGGAGGNVPGLAGVAGNGGNGGNGDGTTGDGGNGGNGGNGGDGGYSLPALGGAGGVGGPSGSHGAVGHFGTLASGPPSDTGGLSTTGTWITNSDGQVVLMHGLNEITKVAPYEFSAAGFGEDDAQFLADSGFNAVRLDILWNAVEPQPGVFDNDYLASVQQTIQMLADHNIQVILNVHQNGYSDVLAQGGDGAPAWAVQTGDVVISEPGTNPNYYLNPGENEAWDSFWANADGHDGAGPLENDYTQMWEHVANYFKGDSDIAGYEIMNEPFAGSNAESYFQPDLLTPFYDQVSSAIRAVDPNTPVFFEPSLDSVMHGTPVDLGTVNDPHGVFSFHNYLPGFLNLAGYPPSLPMGQAALNNAADYASAQGIPAFMTEFGSSYGGIQYELQPADQHLFGWTESVYTNPDNPGKSLVYDITQPPTGANVDTARLDILAEPYAQVVSGTPTSYSFENGVFQFSYSTAHVDGSGDFAAGSQTTFATPTVQFPNGYTVNVVGGHVVSAANAPELVVVSDTGASNVTVTVTAPASS